ncbi:peptidoglycan D,D-transpeptidase FtsI family protein [Wansuia hejianensis]|uniref:Penicillin-binding protein A n=1 Tax=Wansuia hejianensis TaxID=2763667 RepID=A0A926F048_9FIRM|nr:penicillin-binding transpeptidase domain-containing protein [Wansuia hejianensis]MBC8589549.1 penicillin-binding protein A [Wansuia hejianensis]
MNKNNNRVKENKRIIVVLACLCTMLVVLIGYLSYFQVFKAQEVKNNAYNKRTWINEENVLRGSILDRNGNVLVYNKKTEDSNKRYYKYGRLYSHVIGYSYREYGKTGLELKYNNALLDISDSTALNDLKSLILPTSIGNDLKLTIDHNLQEKSRSLLEGKKGAIVAMNPKTGEVYSMVSMPDFDTSNLNDHWKGITESEDSPLLNRATQGLYAPGSVFKVITTVAALDTPALDNEYKCSGTAKIDGYTFKDYSSRGHGNITLEDALRLSCNTYYVDRVQYIGKDRLGSTADKFMINSKIDFDLPMKSSSFPYKKSLSKTELSASAIGQGEVLVTPLNMAMVASAIANDGQMVKPILVKEIVSKNNRILESYSTEVISDVTSSIKANQIKDMMLKVVESGTGTNAKIKNVKVAGKTGTAENPSGKSHSWFIGFAPYDDPKIAIAVILEEEGVTGGTGAAPIARDIFIHGLNNIDF